MESVNRVCEDDLEEHESVSDLTISTMEDNVLVDVEYDTVLVLVTLAFLEILQRHRNLDVPRRLQTWQL